jgi:ABC-2 type transport system permease protein
VNKSLIVAKHEFLVTIRRVWFVISTFVFPLIFLGIGGVMLLIMKSTVEQAQAKITGLPLGVVDKWGGAKSDPKSFEILRLPDEEAALAALREKKIATWIVIPGDYVETGRVIVKTSIKPTLMTSTQTPLPAGLRPWLVDNVLHDVGEHRLARAKHPVDEQMVYLDATGGVSTEDAQASVKRSITGYAFFFLLFMSIFTASGYLLNGMADEKENRVMEIVLSSITPGQLMLGKLLGLGAAGLLQLGIWMTMGVVGIVAFAVQILLDPLAFVYCFVFFLLGYLLFGSLMLGFGALGTNFRESQQMASLWTFIGISPIFIHMPLVESPHGTLARVFSYIPLTAPVTMMLRYVTDPKGMPWYDVPLVLAILVLSTVLALRASAKLYRVGLLLYGKRPSIREIWRWLRSPAS